MDHITNPCLFQRLSNLALATRIVFVRTALYVAYDAVRTNKIPFASALHAETETL